MLSQAQCRILGRGVITSAPRDGARPPREPGEHPDLDYPGRVAARTVVYKGVCTVIVRAITSPILTPTATGRDRHARKRVHLGWPCPMDGPSCLIPVTRGDIDIAPAAPKAVRIEAARAFTLRRNSGAATRG